ncbi:phasin, PhaP [Psychromarinibacter sediminicola]|nr:phasin, PhaP [Psychromarinibacter sediminicola]
MKDSAVVGEKLAHVALQTALHSNDQSGKWTKETLANVGTAVAAKDDPADYTRALSEFAAAQGATTTEHVAALTEITRTAQAQAMDVLLEAGTTWSDTAASTIQKTAAAMTSAAMPAWFR